MKASRYTVALAVAAALLMSVVATASASAQTFKASKLGALTSTGGVQTFKTHGLTVECEKVTDSGTVTEETTTHQKITAKYEKCNVAAEKVTISAAEYEFFANGTVSILKPITVETSPATLCTITVPAQGPLSTITYKNVSGKIEIVAAVTKITSTGTGTLEVSKVKVCDYTEAEEKEGTYSGDSVSTLTGGTLEWVS